MFKRLKFNKGNFFVALLSILISFSLVSVFYFLSCEQPIYNVIILLFCFFIAIFLSPLINSIITNRLLNWWEQFNYSQRVCLIIGISCAAIFIPFGLDWDKVFLYHYLSNDPLNELVPFKNLSFLFPLISSPIIFFGLSLLIQGLSKKIIKKPNQKEQLIKHWILFSLVIAIFWLLLLLIFWPGDYSGMVLSDVTQMNKGTITDWHPIVYTWLVDLSIRWFSSPTALIILQIITLALIIGWGLGYLNEMGVQQNYLWLIVLLFSLIPSINLMMVKLLYDIPFASFFLLITILLMKIVVSNGKWLENKKNLTFLSVSSLLLILFRHNGIFVIIGVFVALLFDYRKQYRGILAGFLVVIIAVWFYQYPVYHLLGVERDSSGHIDNILLHHISAHIDSGTNITDEERNYIQQLLPFDEWKYSCCTNGEVWYNPKFNQKIFHSNSSRNYELALNLFIQDPFVDINHTFCASNVIWKISGGCSIKFPIPSRGEKYPELSDNIINLMKASKKIPLINSIVWHPSIYLYLTIFCVSVLAIRHSSPKVLLIATPVILQSGLLFFINRTQGFRYQYCVVIVGIFTLAFLAIPQLTIIEKIE